MEKQVTHRLGFRAFSFFFWRQVRWLVLVAVLVGAGWWAAGRLPPFYAPFARYGLQAASLLVLALAVFKIVRAYFEYRGYGYRFEEEFFHITRGYITRHEIGVVYHQIQTVTLRHGFLDRLAGVSHLTIIMNGSQRQPAEVVLPALESKKARLVQQELLRQARLRGMHVPAGDGLAPAEIWR